MSPCLRITSEQLRTSVLIHRCVQQGSLGPARPFGLLSLVNYIFRSAIDEGAEQERIRENEFQQPETLIMAIEDDSEFQNMADEELLKTAVRNLPYEYRAVYLLHDMVSFSVSEICSMLELSEIEVRAFLHRARVMVCRSLRRFREMEKEALALPFTQSFVTKPRVILS